MIAVLDHERSVPNVVLQEHGDDVRCPVIMIARPKHAITRAPSWVDKKIPLAYMTSLEITCCGSTDVLGTPEPFPRRYPATPQKSRS